jgi:hypothetical protein
MLELTRLLLEHQLLGSRLLLLFSLEKSALETPVQKKKPSDA